MNAPIKDPERGGLPSASAMDRFISCPGSFNAERGMPQLPELEVTSQGTDIHEAMETGDATDLAENEQEIAVRLERMERETLENWSVSIGLDVSVSRVAEQRFWIRDRKTLALIASAKLDSHYLAGKHALLIDFKSGYKKATSSEHNWQLITQAIALWHEYPHLEHFRAAIAASRLSSSVDAADFTVDQLRYGEFVIQAAYWRSRDPEAPRNPGLWCQYCKARANCPNAAAYALLVLFLVPDHGKLAIVEQASAMSLPQLAVVQHRAGISALIFTAIKDRLKTFSDAELATVGLKLVPGAEIRSIENVMIAHRLLLQTLPEAEVYGCEKIAVGKIQTAYRAHTGCKTKEAVAWTNEAMAGLITVRQNKPSLESL